MSEPRDERPHEGPVFHGDSSHNLFAWGNETVTQTQQTNNRTVAEGYEELAARVTELLRRLPEQGLPDQDREDAETAAGEVLTTLTRSDPPEETRLRRALTMLRGALAPVAMGAAAGTTVATQEWARAAIESLIV